METTTRPFLALFGASIALHALVLSVLPKAVTTRVTTSPVEMALYVPTPAPIPTPKVEPRPVVKRVAVKGPAKAAAPVTEVIAGPSRESTSDVGLIPVITAESPFGPAAKEPAATKSTSPGTGFAPAGSADSEPVLLGEIKVPYPTEAHRNDIEGTVRMLVTIDANGVVTSVKVLGGPGYGLNEAARDAMLRFRFKPAMKRGEAVGYSFTYAYTFSLE